MYEQLNLEQRLVLLASRSKDSIDINEIVNVLENNLNWEKVLFYASKNKVLFLIYENISELGFKKYIPKFYINLIEDTCYCNNIRNTEKLDELHKIHEAMNNAKIDIIPVKGGYLIDNIYKNRRARVTNDIDALIRKRDIKQIDAIMKSLGYVVGDLDIDKNRINEPSQTKKVLYRTKMYNLLPYIKPGQRIPNSYIMFDFSFALDFSLDLSPVEEMIDNSIKVNGINQLSPEHFFVHMCCHHYREASHIEWIRIGKDLNLIKFCDVREFILQKMNKELLHKAISFGQKHNLLKAIYFTIFFLKEIYNDGYEMEILDSLNIEDTSFLYKFSDGDITRSATRKKDFWTSIFDENNKDEIMSAPKYDTIMR